MRSGSKSNALLVELLIVVMFFMLASTTLLQVYSTARGQSVRSGRLTAALNAAQNTADGLYAARDGEKTLADMGFSRREGEWILPGEEFDVAVLPSREEIGGGMLARYQVRAVYGDDTLVNLPVARYWGAEE